MNVRKVFTLFFRMLFILIFTVLINSSALAFENDYDLLWNYETGFKVEDLALSPDNSHVAVASGNHVYLLERGGTLVWKYDGVPYPEEIAVSSKGSYVAVLSRDSNEIHCLNRSGKLVWSYKASNKLYDIGVFSDGHVVAFNSYGRTIRNNCRILCIDNDGKIQWKYDIKERPGEDISVASDGSLIAVLSYEEMKGGKICTITILDKNGKSVKEIKPNFEVVDLAFSSDGSYLAVAGKRFTRDYELSMMNVKNVKGTSIWESRIEKPVSHVEVSSDGCLVAATEGELSVFGPKGSRLWIYRMDDIFGFSVDSYGSAIVVSGNKVCFFAGSDFIETFIEDVRNETELKKKQGFVMEEADSLLSQAEEKSKNGQYKKAFELIVSARAIDPRYVENPLEDAKIEVEIAISEGLNVSSAQSLILKAEDALMTGEYEKAYETADEAKAIVFELRDISKRIGDVEDKIESEKPNGYSMDETEALLLEAKDALNRGDYERALEITYQVENILTDLEQMKFQFEEIKNELKAEELKGSNVEHANSLLSEAEENLYRGEYDRTDEILKKIRILPPDRDRDGIPDSTDLVPSINDFYLYMGGGVFLIGSMFTIGAGFKKLKKSESEIRVLKEVYKSKNMENTSENTPQTLGFGEGLHPLTFPEKLGSIYEVIEFLGEGGFARVFKVKRKEDGKLLALKIPQEDENISSIFIKEVSTWYTLNHKNIVKLYKADYLPIPHIEMEYIEGTRKDGQVIRELEDYPKPLKEKEALKLLTEISYAVDYAHQEGIYHHDLKPLNILLQGVQGDENKVEEFDIIPKITDFGLARLGERSSNTTIHAFSPMYAAPEQVDRNTYGKPDHRTDIYQLGLIFYNLLSGRLPYEGSSAGIVLGKIVSTEVKPERISSFNPELKSYDGIFEKVFAKYKEDRFQTISDFLNAVLSLRD